jgi:hypothetical protein
MGSRRIRARFLRLRSVRLESESDDDDDDDEHADGKRRRLEGPAEDAAIDALLRG